MIELITGASGPILAVLAAIAGAFFMGSRHRGKRERAERVEAQRDALIAKQKNEARAKGMTDDELVEALRGDRRARR